MRGGSKYRMAGVDEQGGNVCKIYKLEGSCDTDKLFCKRMLCFEENLCLHTHQQNPVQPGNISLI